MRQQIGRSSLEAVDMRPETFKSSAHGDWGIIPEGFFRSEIGSYLGVEFFDHRKRAGSSLSC